jgi:hypothetical protein
MSYSVKNFTSRLTGNDAEVEVLSDIIVTQKRASRDRAEAAKDAFAAFRRPCGFDQACLETTADAMRGALAMLSTDAGRAKLSSWAGDEIVEEAAAYAEQAYTRDDFVSESEGSHVMVMLLIAALNHGFHKQGLVAFSELLHAEAEARETGLRFEITLRDIFQPSAS